MRTPIITQQLDCSPKEHKAAVRAIDEGSSNLLTLDRAIKQQLAPRNCSVVNQHRNTMAPIHYLPDDVMLLIAEQTRFTSDGKKAPWKFSTVCKQWRQLALSHPYLWADIELRAPYGWDSSLMIAESLCERAETQLGRAGSCVLTLQIHLPCILPYAWAKNDGPLRMKKTAKKLLEKHRQCRLLNLSGELPDDWDVELSRSPSHEHSGTDNPARLEENSSVNTPVLKTLVLKKVLNVQTIPIQWSGLIDLSLEGCRGTASDFLGVLRRTKQLRTLHIGSLRTPDAHDHKSVNASLNPVTLPRLHELSLASSGDKYTIALNQSIVQHIITPSLLKLCLESMSKALVEEFLRQSDLETRLQVLEVRRCEVDRCIIPLLQTVHRIETLIIQSPEYNLASKLVKALRADATPQLCPRLTTLVLRKAFLNSVDLQTTIQSRVRPNSHTGSQTSLKHLSLKSVTFLDLRWMSHHAKNRPGLELFREMEAIGLLGPDSRNG